MSLVSQRIEQEFLRYLRTDDRVRRAYVANRDQLLIVVELKHFTTQIEIELRTLFIRVISRNSPDVFHDARDYTMGDLSVTA